MEAQAQTTISAETNDLFFERQSDGWSYGKNVLIMCLNAAFSPTNWYHIDVHFIPVFPINVKTKAHI